MTFSIMNMDESRETQKDLKLKIRKVETTNEEEYEEDNKQSEFNLNYN